MKNEVKQPRWKSVVAWSALVSQIFVILVLTKVIGPELAEGLRVAIVGILQALVGFGVLNNPTNKEGF
jgi:uncharacterized membrane protein